MSTLVIICVTLHLLWHSTFTFIWLQYHHQANSNKEWLLSETVISGHFPKLLNALCTHSSENLILLAIAYVGIIEILIKLWKSDDITVLSCLCSPGLMVFCVDIFDAGRPEWYCIMSNVWWSLSSHLRRFHHCYKFYENINSSHCDLQI
jgi:hypothetical protein